MPWCAQSGNWISRDAVPSEEISNLGHDHLMLSSVTCSFSSRAWISAPASALIPSVGGCLCSVAVPLCSGRYSTLPAWPGSLSCCCEPCYAPALLLVKVTAWLVTQRCLTQVLNSCIFPDKSTLHCNTRLAYQKQKNYLLGGQWQYLVFAGMLTRRVHGVNSFVNVCTCLKRMEPGSSSQCQAVRQKVIGRN